MLPEDATAEEIQELAIKKARNSSHTSPQSCTLPQSRTFSQPNTLPQSSTACNRNSSKAVTVKTASPLRFTDAMDVAMYKAMVKAHRKGLRGKPAGFKPTAWKGIIAAVQAQIVTGQMVTKKQCEGRKATQKTKWAEWKRLETLSGWGYNHMTRLFVASDEQWEREIQVRFSSNFV